MFSKKKLLILANEQSEREWRKYLLIFALHNLNKDFLNRQRFNEGNFSSEEKEIAVKAVSKVREITEGDKSFIKLVKIDSYTIDNVKSLMRRYAFRGYHHVVIDTSKPTEDSQMENWRRFKQDYVELDRLASSGGFGLDLAVWTTVQQTDSAINNRILTFDCIGEGRKSKDTCSVVLLNRMVWDDEYEGGSHEILVHRDVTKEEYETFTKEANEYYTIVKKEQVQGVPNTIRFFFKLKPNKAIYKVAFIRKNRLGQDRDSGAYEYVYRVDLNGIIFTEVGWTKIVE
jgi:hypothetical protein